MSLPPVDQHAVVAFRRFYTLLPRSTDASLVILKIHLLVEEQVRSYIEERVSESVALKKAGLTCHQAIWVAEALCTENIHPNVWEAARKLNELRNRIAHNLEPAGVLERMSAFCTLIGLSPQTRAATALPPQPSPLEDFEFAASMLYNEIAMYVKRKPVEILQLVTGSQSDS